MIVSTLFHNPQIIRFDTMLWFLAPLCVAVAIVYKTVRTRSLRRLPLEILVLMGYMIVGLVALGAGLWLVQEYWP